MAYDPCLSHGRWAAGGQDGAQKAKHAKRTPQASCRLLLRGNLALDSRPFIGSLFPGDSFGGSCVGFYFKGANEIKDPAAPLEGLLPGVASPRRRDSVCAP